VCNIINKCESYPGVNWVVAYLNSNLAQNYEIEGILRIKTPKYIYLSPPADDE
jgi:hypothetical protein